MATYRPYTYPEIRRIADMWNRDVPLAVIACDTQRTIGAINHAAHKNRGLFKKRKPGGPVRVNIETAAQMRRDGATLALIAERFGVSTPAVHYAIQRGQKL